MEEHLAQVEDGKRRLRDAGERKDAWTAEQVEDGVANVEVVELQEMPTKTPDVFKSRTECRNQGRHVIHGEL